MQSIFDPQDLNDDTQLLDTNENSSSETDEPEAQGVKDDSASSSSVEENDAEHEGTMYNPPNGMKMDRGFTTSGGLMGIKYDVNAKTNKVINPAERGTNKDLRRATNIEKEMWNRKLLSMWKMKEKKRIIS
jgi:hypothetical protein